ncbi:MAG: ComEC/Rec2 family competence protein, partial [Ignavibacteria bacterium]
MAIGILLSYYSAISLVFLPSYIFILSLVIIAISSVFQYRYISRGSVPRSVYLFLLVLFGFTSFQFRYFKIDDDNISRIIPSGSELKSTVRGTISERPEIKDDRIRFILSDITIEGREYGGSIIAAVYKSKFKESLTTDLIYGDIVEISGKLERLPHRRNPGEFDYGEYLRLHEIDAVFTGFGYDKISLSGHDEPSYYKSHIIYPVREYSIRVIDEMIGGDEGEFLKGLVLGERSNISRGIKENFINAGVAHIIAVSGLNVAYVIIILWGILTFIPVRQSYKIFSTIFLLIFYMNLTGNSPSIVRATIMASVFLLAQIIERRPNGYNIVSFAGLVILLIDSRQLFDAGFILSFSAIFSIMIIYPVLDKWICSINWYRELNENRILTKAVKGAVTLFLGTLAAQLGTLPITAIMFRKISIVSLAANLFAIPLSNIALALGFIMIICSTFFNWLASVFATLNSALLYLLLALIESSAKLDFSFIETYFVDWLLFA